MRCLYCGKEIALFKRLRGGEFCSDGHRQRYQEEYTQLALNRLLQANAPKENENDSGGAKPKETRAEPESPALRRRERAGREETPGQAPSTPLIPIPTANAAASKPVRLDMPPKMQPALKMAVLEPEPAAASAGTDIPVAIAPIPEAVQEPEVVRQPELVFEPAAVESLPIKEIDEPPPAGMSSFLVEFPVPVLVDAVPSDQSTHLEPKPQPILPRLRGFQQDLETAQLDSAARITLSLFTVTDFPTPPRERGLELREFVRGVPQVEINVKPAVESGFEPVREAFEVQFDAHAPDGAPGLWLASEPGFPAFADGGEILLGELARLDFALTEWGAETRTEDANIPIEPPSMGTARLEPMRVELAVHQPAPLPPSRPEPLHFEPVHIDPVFMEKIAHEAAGKPAVEQEPVAQPIAQREAAQPVEEVAIAPEPAAIAEETAPAVAPEPAPLPVSITKPIAVTLHGMAPTRGKPVQVFAAAEARLAELQIPRETALPLRPSMVLGAPPKPAIAEQAAVAEKSAAKSIPIPQKSESRPDQKSRKPEVRVLPIQAKDQVRPEPVKSPAIKPEPSTPVAPKPEPVKEAPAVAARSKETPAQAKTIESSKPLEAVKPVDKTGPAEAPKLFEAPRPKAPVEIRTPTTVLPVVKPRVAAEQGSRRRYRKEKPRVAPPPSPVEEMDLLGLPKLSFQQNETFWSRLPAPVRLGGIAAVLALIVVGVVLTSRGAGSVKPAAGPVEPVMVEEPAMATTAGWTQDWFADRAGSKQGRHVDVKKGSLTLRDYRLVFEGQIERGAIGWVYRANEKSFYVEKIQVVTPGHEPVVSLVRFAVINGEEQPRVQIPLSIQAHLDTTYKVRMDVVGDRFTTWVQDQKIDQWTDGQLAVGGVGPHTDANDAQSSGPRTWISLRQVKWNDARHERTTRVFYRRRTCRAADARRRAG